MRNKYLLIGLLILVILGLGFVKIIKYNNQSNNSNIIYNNSEKIIPNKEALPNADLTNKYRNSNSANSSNPTNYNPTRNNEYLNDNNTSSDNENIDDNTEYNNTDSNSIDSNDSLSDNDSLNDSFFNEDIGKNVTWEIKISGTTGMMFDGAYVDRYGPPKYVTDNVPKEYTVISDILAVKFQKSKKEDNGILTIEIIRDGEKIMSNSTEYSLAYVCKTECFAS